MIVEIMFRFILIVALCYMLGLIDGYLRWGIDPVKTREKRIARLKKKKAKRHERMSHRAVKSYLKFF